jgi:hypothetical protein
MQVQRRGTNFKIMAVLRAHNELMNKYIGEGIPRDQASEMAASDLKAKAKKTRNKPKTYRWTILFADGRHASGQQDTLKLAAEAMRDRLNDMHMNDAADMRKFFLSDGSQLMEYTGSEINDARNFQ